MPQALAPQVWLPLALAAGLFALREWQRPADVAPSTKGVSVELPVLRGSATPRRDVEYELDRERSSVRFLVECDGRERVFVCTAPGGRFVLTRDPTKSTLELRLDLASLRDREPASSARAECDLWSVLGADKHSQVVYRAALVSNSTTPLPCLERKLWDGRLRFGRRVVRQPMAVWQTALPGQPLRLQGYGTVRREEFGLTRHRLFELMHGPREVTIGLDLAWKRVEQR